MFRLLLPLFLILSVGCTTTITEVIEVYPTELTIVSSASETSVGETLGLGANASIIGKGAFEPRDSISVTVRDRSVLQVVSDFRGQQVCTPGGFSSGICLQRWVEFRALKPGETHVIFRIAGTADSVKVNVHPSGKG